MPSAALPSDEASRLASLHRLDILDTGPDVIYDAFVDLACSVFDAPIAAVSLVDADRQWFKASRGLAEQETPRDVSFCGHAILQPDQTLVVPDAALDGRFADNPLVTGAPGIRFYVGVPLTDRDGHALGTLCVADYKPRTVDPEMVRKLRHIATGATAALQLHGCVQELDRLAYTDPLTGLVNRAAFDRHLAASGTNRDGKRRGRGGDALLMLGLDGFKGINDLFGHLGGDAALREVAQRLQRVARGGDFLARLGGDEFALVCKDVASPQAAMAIAVRIHAAMADTFRIEGQVVPLRTSIGIAFQPRHASDPEGWVRAADAALADAKAAGRGLTRLAQPGGSGTVGAPPAPGRMTLRNLMREALLQAGREPFHLNFQPILDLASGQVTTFEALVRWTRPDGQRISPGVFVPVAEEAGLVAHLDRWVLRTACATAMRWPKPWAVSVNLSPAGFALLDMVELVRETLAETGLPASRLKVEVTETMAIPSPEQLATALRGMRDLGVAAAVDDFGSGHASLAYLRRYPFSVVKADQSLLVGLGTDAQALPVLRALVDLSRSFGLPVVTEGVETEAQLRIVQELGVERVQGYLLGRPVPESEIEATAHAAEARLAHALSRPEPADALVAA